MTVRPNFFIVGAPKSGTTAMHSYLREHPDVFAPDFKEPHFFADDLSYRGYLRDPKQYFGLFGPGKGKARIGEASVWYLYSQTAARNIRKELGQVKIVVMLRNPVDLLYSLHSQFVYSGTEDIEDFRAALEAEPARRTGAIRPRTDYDVKLLYYSDVIDFAPQLQRYYDEFGRESVHVVLFDDFRADTRVSVEECLRFLDLTPEVPKRLGVVNPNTGVRSFALQGLLRRPSPCLRAATRSLVPQPVRRFIIGRLQTWNTVVAPRPALAESIRNELSERYRGQIQQLASLIRRDLGFWFDGEPRERAA